MSFTEKLNKLIAERHINKVTLSKEAGIPYTTIDGFYKKGSNNIKLSTLRKLAVYFDCSLDFLVDDENDESNQQESPQTIAAHFEGDTFTEEEMADIQAYAEFVKNRRKS